LSFSTQVLFFVVVIVVPFFPHRNADKVEDILDEIQEQKDLHDTISDAIARPGQDMFDDVRLLKRFFLLPLS